MTETKSHHHFLINHKTGCQYMFQNYFKSYSEAIKVYIDVDGHGWRLYEDNMIGGNYSAHMVREFWNALIRHGFTTNYENC